MSRRPLPQYSSMTSLLDVLFILVFASLIYSAGLERERAQQRAAALQPGPPALAGRGEHAAPPRSADHGAHHQQTPPGGVTPPAHPPDPQAVALADARRLSSTARDQLVHHLDQRKPVVVRIARDGTVRAIERLDGDTLTSLPVGLPLVQRVPDPDVALVYLGDQTPALRICSIVRLKLDRPDLSDALVIVAPDVPLAQLSVAAAGGITRDVERCQSEQGGIAALVEPEEATPR